MLCALDEFAGSGLTNPLVMGAIAIRLLSEVGADRPLRDTDEADEARPLSETEEGIGGRWTIPYSDGLKGSRGSSSLSSCTGSASPPGRVAIGVAMWSTNHGGGGSSMLGISGVSMSMVGGVGSRVDEGHAIGSSC